MKLETTIDELWMYSTDKQHRKKNHPKQGCDAVCEEKQKSYSNHLKKERQFTYSHSSCTTSLHILTGKVFKMLIIS